jgi:dTDP-4-dehydrorhamnose 3,5-epimerase
MIRNWNKNFKGTNLDGIICGNLINYYDERGSFSQSWTIDELYEFGFRPGFIQQNYVKSFKGVLRGMHRQNQTKLLRVIRGQIFDVVLNPETKEWAGYILNENEIIFIPAAYAHGYFVTSDEAVVEYFVDEPYDPEKEEIYLWSNYGIEWPLITDPIVSSKDEEA